MTLTRRQKTVLWALENGWVAELRRPVIHGVSTDVWIMRPPGALETTGGFTQRRTINALLESGLAVRLTIPSRDITLVLEIDYYRARQAAFDVLTADTPPRTTNHPPPRFRDRFPYVVAESRS